MTVCIYRDQVCECCGADLELVSVPAANSERRRSVRCTNCPAGGDVLPDGTKRGPALEGAHGAEADALNTNTTETAATTAGEKA